MKKIIYREVVFFKNYFKDFYKDLPSDVQAKFDWTIDLIEAVSIVPSAYLKHITGVKGLYEMRVEWDSNIYRVFCFFDKGKLIVLMNGFQKKTQKTPRSEIVLAEKIREEYLNRSV